MKRKTWVVHQAIRGVCCGLLLLVCGEGWAAASKEAGPLDAVLLEVRDEVRKAQGKKAEVVELERSSKQARWEVRAPEQKPEPVVAIIQAMPANGASARVVVGPPESEGDLYVVAKEKKGWRVARVERFDDIADAGEAELPEDEPAQLRLAYERQGVVYLNSGAGSKERKVGPGYQPALSPDGVWLAWCVAPDGRDSDMRTVELRVAPVDGLPSWRVVFKGIVSEPCWWPDASRIVFWKEDDQGNNILCEVAPEGGSVRSFYRHPDGGRLFGLAVQQGKGGIRCITQNMADVVSVGLDGKAESAPLARWIGQRRVQGALRSMVNSSDRFVPSPADPDTWMVTASRQGSALFDSVVHEPISNLILHQGWLGVGKNMGLLPDTVSGWDPAWTPGGKWVYFMGYRDVHAKERYPFRILRVRPNGSGLVEVARGERPSVARLPIQHLSREAAAARVLALPDYKDWVKAKPVPGHSGPRVEVMEENEREFLVRVVEHIEDDMPRRVTVGWYSVNRRTGKVTSTLP